MKTSSYLICCLVLIVGFQTGCFPTVRDKQVADAKSSKNTPAKKGPKGAKGGNDNGKASGLSGSSGMSIYKERDPNDTKMHPNDVPVLPEKPSDLSKEAQDRMKKFADAGPPSVGGKKVSASSLANRFSKGVAKDKDSSSMGVRVIMKFDKNKDGVVETKEVPKSIRQYVMVADANKDGKLTKAEIKSLQNGMNSLPTAGAGSANMSREEAGKSGGQFGGMLKDLLGSMDKNGDGKVQLSELDPSTRSSVAVYDKNKDGILSKEEMSAQNNSATFGGGNGGAPGPGGGSAVGPGGGGGQDQMMEQMLSGLDKNGDGKVSVEELPLSIRRNMMKADTNKDGFISGDEMLNGFLEGRGGGSVADMKKSAADKLKKKLGLEEGKKKRSRRSSRSRRSRSRRSRSRTRR